MFSNIFYDQSYHKNICLHRWTSIQCFRHVNVSIWLSLFISNTHIFHTGVCYSHEMSSKCPLNYFISIHSIAKYWLYFEERERERRWEKWNTKKNPLSKKSFFQLPNKFAHYNSPNKSAKRTCIHWMDTKKAFNLFVLIRISVELAAKSKNTNKKPNQKFIESIFIWKLNWRNKLNMIIYYHFTFFSWFFFSVREIHRRYKHSSRFFSLIKIRSFGAHSVRKIQTFSQNLRFTQKFREEASPMRWDKINFSLKIVGGVFETVWFQEISK